MTDEKNRDMKCSVVIRSYNEEDHIGQLLVGLSAQNLPPHEIILVDSGSTDDTVSIARSFGVNVISIRKEEFSFGRALNIGCAAATGDFLVFVSAHVYPSHRTWLEKLVAPMSDERVALSYGKQRGNATNKFSEHQIFRKWFPDESASPQKTYFCNNANCVIRRDMWVKYPYDEVLSGLEDLDWAKKVQAEGMWLAYAADAEIIHVHDESWAGVRNRYRREAMAMKKINDQASFSFLDLLRLLPRNIISDYREASRQGLFFQESISILFFRVNQLVGTYRGYHGPCEVTAEMKDRFYYPLSHKRHFHYDALPAIPERERIDYDILLAEKGKS